MRIAENHDAKLVGMDNIKSRRLGIQVGAQSFSVGDCVPFYFCPRSIMLYILHMGNHPDINYREGQRPIIHLQADFLNVTAWAKKESQPWALTDRNAGSYVASFYSQTSDLDKIDWKAVENSDFRDPSVKEGKQAEFLFYERMPWQLIDVVGVQNETTAREVQQILLTSTHQPSVEVKPNWYY